MANNTLAVIMIWVLLGIVWSSLHDIILIDFPANNPIPVTESPDTWRVMYWIWNFLPVIIGLNLGVAAYKSEGSYGLQKIAGTTKNGIILLLAVTSIMLLWLSTYNFVFHTLPDTLTILHINTAPPYLLTIYNSAMLVLIIGLVAIMFIAAL
jgi:hypothetical protein